VSRSATAPTTGTWLVTPEKFLSPDQVQVLRAYLEGERARGVAVGDRYAVRNAAMVEALLGTGLRVSELCHLTLGDLFLDSASPSVLVRRGKGGKSRLVAVGERLAAYFQVFLTFRARTGAPADPASPVFVSERRGRVCRSAAHRIWKAALEGAGLPTRWGVHATRHSYAVELYRKTRDLRLTQRQLGHSSPVITTLYANLLDDDVRRGVAMVWA
jgi:site-specific recombinase XerD